MTQCVSSNDDPRLAHTAAGHSYAEDVVSGAIPACRWVKLACQRHSSDLSRTADPAYPYRFDPVLGGKICHFISQLPHVDGVWESPKIQLLPWQKFILSTVYGWVRKTDGLRRFQRAYLAVPRKNGKALALDTPIPTPTGWTTMGDIEAGDYVLGTDGTPRRVVATTGVQLDRPCYRVNFTNGESIVADAEHQWLTEARRDRDNKKNVSCSSVKTTQQIAESVNARDERNHRVSVPSALQLPDALLPVAPYVLGVWLGDGDSAGTRITIGDEDSDAMLTLIRAESQAIRKVSGLYKYSMSDGSRTQAARNISLAAKLRGLGVLNNKHIPTSYLRASYAQRLALFQGLMDTDGTCSAAGQCSFTTISERLHEDFVELARTLGLKVGVQRRNAMIGSKNCGLVYTIHFFAYSDQPVFGLNRKAGKQKAKPPTKTRASHIHIQSCESVPSVPVKCIQVDHKDGMYIAGKTFVPTHNSTLAAGIALYGLTLDGETGAQVYCAATTLRQALYVFNPAKAQAEQSKALFSKLGLQVNAQSLIVPSTNSRFTPICSNPGDGGGASTFICDEFHEHTDAILFDAITRGMGARRQPLTWVITTAGSNIAGPCYDLERDVKSVLSGEFTRDSTFGIVYGLDPEDQWNTLKSARKANPSWGVSVIPGTYETELEEATQNASKQGSFRTKRLNEWMNAATGYLNASKWAELADKTLSIDDFKAQECVIGLDLASKLDLCAAVSLFRREIDGTAHFYAFCHTYLPEDVTSQAGNSHYAKWAADGYLTATPGNITDQVIILHDLLDAIEHYKVQALAFDQREAGMITQLIGDQTDVTRVEVPQRVETLSPALKELQALIISGRIHHDGNPVLSWCISNVIAREDANENVFPRKAKNELKIDCVSALLNALSQQTTLDPSSQATAPPIAFFLI